MQRQYNLRNPAVKRLMKEAQELREATEQYHAQPLDENLFEWHFTIRGPADSAFEGGLYHGRIILPPEYPMKPPSIILLTPNGRFETNKKICLSISGYHPESWQPSWSIRTALLAIIGFMPTHGAGAIGSLDYPPQERKSLAKKSTNWKCPSCGDVNGVLPEVTAASEETNRTARELASQISFQAEKEGKTSSSSSVSSDSAPSSNSASSSNSTTTSTAPTPVTSPLPVTAATTPANSTSSTVPAPNMFPGRFPYPPFMPNPWGYPVSSSQQTGTTDSKFGPTFPLPFVGAPVPPVGFGPQQTSGAPRLPFPPPPWMMPPFPPTPAAEASQATSLTPGTPQPVQTSAAPSAVTSSTAVSTATVTSGAASVNQDSNLRHRNVTTPTTQQSSSSSASTGPATAGNQSASERPPQATPPTPVSPPTPQTVAPMGRGTLFLVAVLTIAISLLLVRRVLITI